MDAEKKQNEREKAKERERIKKSKIKGPGTSLSKIKSQQKETASKYYKEIDKLAVSLGPYKPSHTVEPVPGESNVPIPLQGMRRKTRRKCQKCQTWLEDDENSLDNYVLPRPKFSCKGKQTFNKKSEEDLLQKELEELA